MRTTGGLAVVIRRYFTEYVGLWHPAGRKIVGVIVDAVGPGIGERSDGQACGARISVAGKRTYIHAIG